MKTPMLKSISGACLLAGVLLLAGCKTTVNTVERAEPIGNRKMVVDKRVITDASLARKVYVVGVSEDMTVGGFMTAQVEVWNTTSSRQRFNYSFEWFDAAGMLVKTSSTALNTCVIDGKESKFLAGTAPLPSARDFRVKFIEAR